MRKIVLLIVLFAVSSASAQRYKIISGEFENLKGITEYNATFSKEGMVVHGFDSEDAFVKAKVEKRKQHKDTLQAINFEKVWYAAHDAKWKPGFIFSFNSRFKNGELKVVENPASRYTMNVQTTWIYPGYDVFIGKEPAKVTAIITVFETSNPSNVLIKVEFPHAEGLENAYDFNVDDRVTAAYEKLAKNITIQLKRFL